MKPVKHRLNVYAINMVMKQCSCQKSFLIKKIRKKFNENNLNLKTQIIPEKKLLKC